MSDIQLTIGGTATQALAEYQKLEKANREQLKAISELKAANNAAAKAERERAQEQAMLSKQAEKAINDSLRPIQIYQKEVNSLKNLLTQGMLTQEQFNQALRKQVELFKARKAATPEARAAEAERIKKEADETKRLADETKKQEKASLDAARAQKALTDEGAKIKDRLLTPTERYNKEMTRLGMLLKERKIDQTTYNRAIKEQEEILRQTNGTASNVGAKILGISREALVTFTGVGGALSAIVGYSDLLKKEHEDFKRLNAERASQSRSFAENVRAMSENFIGDESLTLEGLEPRLRAAAKKTGATPDAVARVMSVAMSARGHLPAETAMQSGEAALALNPKDDAKAATMSGAALDIIKKGIGIEDPRAAMNFLYQLQGAARVTDAGKLAKEFTPAIGTAMLRGDSIETAAERMVQLNNLMDDATGAQSSTSFAALSNRLAKFVPKASAKDARGEFAVPAGSMLQFESAKSTEERIQAMVDSPELRRAFFSSNSFEQAAQAPIEEILSGSARAQDALGKARSSVTTPSVDEFNKFVSERRGMPGQAKLNIAERAEAKTREFAAGQEESSSRGTAREIFDKAINEVQQANRVGPFDAVSKAYFNWSARDVTDPVELSNRLMQLRQDIVPGGDGNKTRNYLLDISNELRLLRTTPTPVMVTSPPEDALGKR